jgi:hypothetical protein
MRYAGALEDALVAVLEYSGQTIGSTTAAEASFSPFGAYMENFANVREAWHARLRGLIAGGRRIALIGVGHQAIMFVNALGLQNYISRVADDLVAKQGHFPPGIAAPIVSSTTLAADPAVGSWLLAISPPAQTQMRTKFAPLIERGLRMYSIFAESSPLETSAQ